MQKFYTTRQVSALLGIKIGALTRALWEGRVEKPDVVPNGRAFIWDIDFINKASWVLRRRDASDIFPKLNKTLKQYSIIGGLNHERTQIQSNTA